MAKLEFGQEITVSIPFTYTVGDVGFYTSKKILNVQSCKDEALAEIEAGTLKEDEVFFDVNIHPFEESDVRNYEIKVSGSGNRNQLIKALKAVIKNIQEGATDLESATWEDSNLLTEISLSDE
jgi:hypothetical protein